MAGISGLVVSGGADIDPTLYGAEVDGPEDEDPPDTHVAHRLASFLLAPLIFLARRLTSLHQGSVHDHARDELEEGLIREALEGGQPILGICRGMQLLNVVLGGTLHPDIASFYAEVPHIRSILPRKRIRVRPGSRLAGILGTESTRVNALHHQAVDTLGEGLEAVAWERAGLIQALEHPDAPFLVGVQWHPEFLPQHPRQRRLVRRLVACARDSGACIAHHHAPL